MLCVPFCEEPIAGAFSRYPDWTDAEQTNWRGQRISSTWPSCLPSLPRWLTGSFIALHRQNFVRVLHRSDYSWLVIAIWLLCLFNGGEKFEDCTQKCNVSIMKRPGERRKSLRRQLKLFKIKLLKENIMHLDVWLSFKINIYTESWKSAVLDMEDSHWQTTPRNLCLPLTVTLFSEFVASLPVLSVFSNLILTYKRLCHNRKWEWWCLGWIS